MLGYLYAYIFKQTYSIIIIVIIVNFVKAVDIKEAGYCLDMALGHGNGENGPLPMLVQDSLACFLTALGAILL